MTEPTFPSPICLASGDLFRDLSKELLRQGKSIRFCALGRSMYPSIREGEAITVEPISPSAVQTGDILLYQSAEHLVAHRVVRIDHGSDVARLFFLRGDTWFQEDLKPVTEAQILGKVIRVERSGRHVDPYSKKAQIRLLVHTVGSRIKKWVS